MVTNGEHWLQARIADRGAVTAMDVGANQGEWVVSLLRVAKDCRVVCYEPVPTTYERLRLNVDDPRAELVNKAMSTEPGEITINSVVGNPCLSSIYDIDAVEAGHETVKVTIPASTGDAEIAAHGFTHIDVVKVDAEGHDLAVLKGFSGAIAAGTVDVFQFVQPVHAGRPCRPARLLLPSERALRHLPPPAAELGSLRLPSVDGHLFPVELGGGTQDDP